MTRPWTDRTVDGSRRTGPEVPIGSTTTPGTVPGVERGRVRSRWEVPTPALLVDLDVLEANLARAAALVAEGGVTLRPHVKTHKCAAIARLQLEAGAAGLCVAKLGEAEALLAAGVRPPQGFLLTTPVHGGLRDRLAALATPSRAALRDRLAALGAGPGSGISVVVDHPEQVESLRGVSGGAPLRVLVDLDVGLHRTGVVGPERAAELARLVASTPGLAFGGVQAYGGQWQHIDDPDVRRDAVGKGMAVVADAVDAIEAEGLEVGVRSGGGTGTLAADLELGVLDELQLGSYALMDREYRDALGRDPDLGDGGDWGQALWVQSTVVSANHEGFVTVDAGLKAFATDAGEPVWPAGGGRYAFFGDEHGLLTVSEHRPLRLGDRVELVPPHCDPTVDRYDVIHLVRGDEVVDIVPVDARGRSQ